MAGNLKWQSFEIGNQNGVSDQPTQSQTKLLVNFYIASFPKLISSRTGQPTLVRRNDDWGVTNSIANGTQKFNATFTGLPNNPCLESTQFLVLIPISLTSILIYSTHLWGQAYNRCETQDRQPLGRDPHRSWCHHHTSVKLFDCSPWIHWLSCSTLVCCHWCPWSHGLWPKKLYTSVEVTPAPVPVPTQRLLVPSFTSVVG